MLTFIFLFVLAVCAVAAYVISFAAKRRKDGHRMRPRANVTDRPHVQRANGPED